jgi:hypothetical protein
MGRFSIRLKPMMLVVLALLVAGTVVEAAEPTDDSEEATISGDIFGKRGGYVHGYLSLGGRWTDNLFFTPDDTESDFITLISPGIRFALPGTKEELLSISTSTTSPGGLAFNRLADPGNLGFQAFLSYAPEIEIYKNNTEEDTTTHLANGLARYRFRGGLSLEAYNQYYNGYEGYDLNELASRGDYQSNLFGISADYELTEKIGLGLNYGNYRLDFKDAINEDRDRTDNSISGAISFRVRPKTSLFVQYSLVDVYYDLESASQKDSLDQRFTGGLSWNFTAKSRGRVQAGIQNRNFDDPTLDSENDFIYQVVLDHRFTPKTSINLRGYRNQDQTTISAYDYTLTHFGRLGYLQQLTQRIRGAVDIEYRKRQFKGDFIAAGDPVEREDDTIALIPSVRYAFNGWLSLGLEYRYAKRDSNNDIWDYTNNQFTVRITGAI